ncbi:hypothetical protein [Methylocystis iwaonis]|uniref:hypothetical protein n=1 Tax=Methylocystis iwaonis TaxID=2885079 RepID=UPI002490D303|nr:hypothetical protein [Methylocystis iwaonis]
MEVLSCCEHEAGDADEKRSDETEHAPDGGNLIEAPFDARDPAFYATKAALHFGDVHLETQKVGLFRARLEHFGNFGLQPDEEAFDAVNLFFKTINTRFEHGILRAAAVAFASGNNIEFPTRHLHLPAGLS